MSEYKELVAILTVMFFFYLMVRAIARALSSDERECKDKRVDELEKRVWELERALASCKDMSGYGFEYERKDTAILSQEEIDLIVERFRESLKQTTHARAKSSSSADTGEGIDTSIKL